MILLERLKLALRSPWLPLALLLLALSTVFVFSGDRGYFYRLGGYHNWMSSHHLTIAVNLSPKHGFQRFHYLVVDRDSTVRYIPYNRFPPGGYAIMKAATLPFEGSPSAQLHAARILMLLFFTAAAVLAYMSLCRLTSNRWIALTAVLLAFSSYYLLYYNDMTANEGMIDFFGVMLTFHGMVVFVQEGRFRQLLVKTCIALLLGWHVLALLLPFVIFGLARDLLRARSASATSTPPHIMSSRRIASTLLRSRYLLLGAVALAFGLSLLAFNFTMEYAALNSETPLTELPSFESLLKRTGVNTMGESYPVASRGWRPVLEGEFRDILRMFIPYSLLGPLDYRGDEVESPMWLSKRLAVALGIALTAACLIGSIFVRPRILFATLASSGFFWVLLAHNSASDHNYEAIYYIGLPLVLFAIVLIWVRRLTSRDTIIAAAAVAALLLFTVSSFQMSRVGYNGEQAQVVRAASQDLLAIRELTAGEPVTILGLRGLRTLFPHVADNPLHYYMRSTLIASEDPLPASFKFIVMRHRIDSDALLTPQNWYVFLYDAPGLTSSLLTSYRSAYSSVVSTDPLERKDFDVYIKDRTVYYVKEPCERKDTTTNFFLHVFPTDIDDIPYHRREYRFDNLDFLFTERGVMFDGKCMASVDLPQYDIAGFRTGSYDDGQVWSAAHVIQGPKLISEYQSIVSTEPVARSEFDVYLDGGKLDYVKEPCAAEDTQASFFLHVVPEDVEDLPDDRRRHGFDNLDFGFDVRGVLFDGKCLAGVGLPQYGIARITTGQFDSGDRVWEVEFAPEARE